jgi:hypothetical protein
MGQHHLLATDGNDNLARHHEIVALVFHWLAHKTILTAESMSLGQMETPDAYNNSRKSSREKKY